MTMKDIYLKTLQFFSSSVQYPAMGVALYRWGAMAQSNSSSDSSLSEESLMLIIKFIIVVFQPLYNLRIYCFKHRNVYCGIPQYLCDVWG